MAYDPHHRAVLPAPAKNPLFLLAFFLLAFLLVLFVPVRYQVQVHNERSMEPGKHHPAENLRVQLQVHWLLHLLQIKASYGPQGFSSRIRAAGIDIPKALAWIKNKKEQKHNRRQAKKRRQKKSEDGMQEEWKTPDTTQAGNTIPESAKGLSQADEAVPEAEKDWIQADGTVQELPKGQIQADGTVQESAKGQIQADGTVQESAKGQIQADQIVQESAKGQVQADRTAADSAQDYRETGHLTAAEVVQEPFAKTDAQIPLQKKASEKEGRPDSKRKKRRKKKKSFPKRKKSNTQKPHRPSGPSEPNPGIFARLRGQIARVRKEIKDETNRYAVSRIWRELLKIICSYKPRKLRADITFSLADPALTGQATGLISLLPWIYRYPCRICPDFTSEQLYLEGEVFAQGRVSVLVFALSALRLLCDKTFMRTVRRLLGRGQK